MRAGRALPFLALICLAAALLALAPSAARADDEVALAVIVGRTSQLTNVSLAELRRVFRAEPPNDGDHGHLIALNQPPQTPDRVGFDRVVLGMDPEAVGRFWIERKTQRGSGPPRNVTSLSTLRRVVEKLPGAISYLRPSQLASEVRAIRVDGKLPEDPGYPLRYRP